MRFFQLGHALRMIERQVLAPEVHSLYEKYKSATDMRITKSVENKFVYSLNMEAASPSASRDLKIEAARLAPRLQKVKEFQDPAWNVLTLFVTNVLLFDPGVSVTLQSVSGSKCLLRTTRNAQQIKCTTQAGVEWHHCPDRPEPWMAG